MSINKVYTRKGYIDRIHSLKVDNLVYTNGNQNNVSLGLSNPKVVKNPIQ